MKIAVPSMDGVSISPHFGRSACFIMFDVDDGKVTGKEILQNSHTAFARGECTGDHQHAHAHSHESVIGALAGCKTILCQGMGWRAAEDLKAKGIQALVVEGGMTPEAAVEAFLAGKLKSGGSFCSCHH